MTWQNTVMLFIMNALAFLTRITSPLSLSNKQGIAYLSSKIAFSFKKTKRA